MAQGKPVTGRRSCVLYMVVLAALALIVAGIGLVLVVRPELDRRQQAKARLEQAETHYQAGVAFQNVGDWEAAEAEFKQVITLDPDYKDAQTRLAEVKARLAQSEATATAEAITLAEQARADAQATTTAETRATVTAQAGAATATVEAVEVHYQKGLAYINLENWAEAQVELQAVFEADPRYEDVQAQLAEVEARLSDIRALTPTAVPVTSTPEGQDLSYTTYEAQVRGTGHQTISLGTHRFCASAGFAGPGGFDVSCKVYESEGAWFMQVEDTTNSDQSTTCYAICFD